MLACSPRSVVKKLAWVETVIRGQRLDSRDDRFLVMTGFSKSTSHESFVAPSAEQVMISQSALARDSSGVKTKHSLENFRG